MEHGLPVLSLVEFRCCSDATIRCHDSLCRAAKSLGAARLGRVGRFVGLQLGYLALTGNEGSRNGPVQGGNRLSGFRLGASS